MHFCSGVTRLPALGPQNGALSMLLLQLCNRVSLRVEHLDHWTKPDVAAPFLRVHDDAVGELLKHTVVRLGQK